MAWIRWRTSRGGWDLVHAEPPVSINLVQASYVFLLDPWCNPAAEMQAIDRVHRMGRQRAGDDAGR
jgi:hypothetical protein